MKVKLYIVFLLYLVQVGKLAAQIVHQVGFDIRPSYVTPTNSFFEGENESHKRINRSLSTHLKYAFRFGENTRYGRLYPYAYQGIGVGYNTFFSSADLGSPVLLYAFQGGRIKQFSSELSIDYEWNFGASFGWKKHDDQYDYMGIVGSKINAYINLGFLLNWQFSRQWSMVAGVDLTHYSNGNTHYPNAGVNLIGGRIGVVHTLADDSKVEETKRGHMPDLVFTPGMSYDLVVYGATRKKGFIKDDTSYLVPGSFGVAGLNFSPMYGFNRYFRAGVSLDAQYDESANIKDYMVGSSSSSNVKFHRPSFGRQFAVGLSVRAEWVMPIFSVNIGIGRNVICKGNDTDVFYQVLALKTFVTKHWFLHTGYQLSKFKDPNNLMLGVGYKFGGK